MAGDAAAATQAAPLPRPSVGDLASRLGEVTVLVAAILYGLGAFSILGQLRQLELHQPSVLSGFAHEDILMKGVGVLLTNVPNFIALVLLLTFAMSDVARAWLRSVVAPGGGASRGERVAFILAYVLLAAWAVLYSTWVGGTLGIIATYAIVLAAWLRGRLLTTPALVGVVAAGSILLGATGTYLYPVPLPVVHVDEIEQPRIEGRLLGTGKEQEMYVVVDEDDGRHVRIVAADDRERVLLDDPTEDPGRVIDHLS